MDAALTLIRERGMEAVTLRDVAEALQTGPASLYAYFASRDVLLEHALDAVYGKVELVQLAEGGWQDALAATIANTIDALEAFPGIGTVALGTIPTHPGALRLAEHELALMEAGGIAGADAALGVDLIAQFVAVTAVERAVRGHGSGRAQPGEDVLGVYQQADAEQFPRVRRLARELVQPDEGHRRDFSVRVIMAGLAASRRT